MWTWYRYDGGSMRPPNKKRKKYRVRPSFKRWSRERLLDVIESGIRARIDNSADAPLWASDIMFRESIAKALRAKAHDVEYCLKILNLKGLVSQGENMAPHDTDRDNGGGDSAWIGSRYELIRPDEKEHVEEPESDAMPNNWVDTYSNRHRWAHRGVLVTMTRRGKRRFVK